MHRDLHARPVRERPRHFLLDVPQQQQQDMHGYVTVSHGTSCYALFIYAYAYLDVYVANLAVADFIFVSTIPFWAFDLIQDEWIFGNAACRMFSYITFLNMSSSILPRIENYKFFYQMVHVT